MGNPKLYVTSYRRYSLYGGLSGEWVDLTRFYNFDQFQDYIYNTVLADEEEPEVMYADFSGMPEALYNESYFDADSFALALLYGNLSEEEKDAFDAYLVHFGNDNPSWEDFEERYAGDFDSDQDFGYWLTDNFGYPEDDDHSYFDYDSFGRDVRLNDYIQIDGHYFYAR